jgi:hypothetical protein
LVLLALPLLYAPVPFTAPCADLNRDGLVNATDLQCEILVFRSLALVDPDAPHQCDSDADCADAPGPGVVCRGAFTKARRCLPKCLAAMVPVGKDVGIMCDNPLENSEACFGTTQVQSADLNCDGTIGNVDIIFLVALVMNAVGGPGTADHDNDGRLNYCDEDSDNDSDPDAIDCAPLDESIFSGAPELCNGLDENCNGKIDEYLGEVSCGTGLCVHNEPACVNGIEGQCDPMAGAMDESCNGIDDDCDGKVDNGSDDFLCNEFLGAPHSGSVACLNGDCAITMCQAGWFDINSEPDDGCECLEVGLELGNGTCQSALGLGAITDVPAGQIFGASNSPAGTGDWYSFTAHDIDEGTAESFHVNVSFLDNPAETFVFDLYYGECGGENLICSAATLIDWSTDFTLAGPKDVLQGVPGPWVSGGGENNCRTDANHSLTPNDFSDDTSTNSHLCSDNTSVFYLRVYAAAGKKPTCVPYKLEISNGLK